jgi:hypothetical protein
VKEFTEIGNIVEQITAAAQDCGAILLDASLTYERSQIASAAITTSTFSELVKAIKPKIIYLQTVAFDADEFIRVTLEIDEDEILDSPAVRKLASKWKKYEGELCTLVVEFIYDNVVHFSRKQVDWLEEFNEHVGSLGDEIDAKRNSEEKAHASETKGRLSEKARKLIADPRFSTGVVGTAKRTVLAENLFPELDEIEIQSVVELAQNEHWLTTAGRKK